MILRVGDQPHGTLVHKIRILEYHTVNSSIGYYYNIHVGTN